MRRPQQDYLYDPKRTPLFRDHYRAPEYVIPDVALHIGLDPEKTRVRSVLQVRRNPDAQDAGGPLVLHGENLKLAALEIVEDGKARPLDVREFEVDKEKLILKRPPAGPFTLHIETEIAPKDNTALLGLYMAGGVACTQCEAQGFRRITYFLDRPDNLARFTTTLEADKAAFPVLLSNGNGDYRQTQDLGNGRHSITWVDPFLKPAYLFAVVGGDLKVIEDSFTTMSGRDIALRIVVEQGYEDKVAWAMQSIKRAMKWDEEAYGREYDLDVFHIAAVEKFNFGAMENKGLNIFNVSALIGNPDTATDEDLIAIEAIIGHEYFHNWSGDRVTLRDWFELTLKEGLTVLRDRQFTADMHSHAVKTIDDATELRDRQFMEDSGPNAHPIRPERVEEFDNIYTGTIYEKGSHVLGMLKTIVGEAKWREGMNAYFSRFDGRAVTCEDFIATHEEISGADLSQFRRWYAQSGTPEISYEGVYDAAKKTYTLTLSQHSPATNDQPQAEKQNLHIPVAVGLIGESGKDAAPTRILHLKEEKQAFVFDNVPGPVVPSVLRGFSAPVKVTTQPSDAELVFRMAHDSDPFNRYEAANRLMLKTLHGLIADAGAGKPLALGKDFIEAYRSNLTAAMDGDMWFAARVLEMPDWNIVTQGLKQIDPDAVDAAMTFMKKTLAAECREAFTQMHGDSAAPAGEKYDIVPEQVGRRALRNVALSCLGKLETPDSVQRAEQQFRSAANMTERYGALAVLSKQDTPQRKKALADFYARYKDDSNVVNKWLRLSAAMPSPDPLACVRELMAHEAFDKTNPNKVRALTGGFVGHHTAFHKKDGSGYAFLADTVITMNAVNPNIAAALSKPLTQFKRYEPLRRKLMISELERIMSTPDLHKGVKEIVGKALDSAREDNGGGKIRGPQTAAG